MKTDEKRGGNYIGVHLRRRDFTWGRTKDVPSITGAATQLQAIAKQHKINSLFIATDGTKEGNSVLVIFLFTTIA